MGSVQQAWHEAMFVGGAFERPADGGTIDVRDKASGEIFATAGRATDADVDRAVAAAKAAQPGWAERTYAERAALLRGVAAALTDRAKSMRELIMRETGCIGGKADYEIGAAVSELTEAAALASRATGEVLPTGHAGRFSLSERLPVGLVGVITPWNFPLVLGMRVIAPAIALGNVVAAQAVAGDSGLAAAWPSPSCSRRPGRRRASSRCCRATWRWASGWSATRTWG